MKIVNKSMYDEIGDRETLYTIFATRDELTEENIKEYKMSVGTLAFVEDDEVWQVVWKKNKKIWERWK